jgi:hypothetical protein
VSRVTPASDQPCAAKASSAGLLSCSTLGRSPSASQAATAASSTGSSPAGSNQPPAPPAVASATPVSAPVPRPNAPAIATPIGAPAGACAASQPATAPVRSTSPARSKPDSASGSTASRYW